MNNTQWMMRKEETERGEKRKSSCQRGEKDTLGVEETENHGLKSDGGRQITDTHATTQTPYKED